MFQTIPDPAWDYASTWESLGEIEDHLSKIQKLLSSEKAENQNDEIDIELNSQFGKINAIILKSGFSGFLDMSPKTDKNEPPDDFPKL